MRYRIGDLEIALEQFSLPLVQDEWVQKFVSEHSGKADIVYHQAFLEPGMLDGSRVLEHTANYELRQTERGIFLLNHWATCRMAYGIWLDELDGLTKIYVNPELNKLLPMTVSHLLTTMGVHHKLLQKKCVLMHASYIEYRGRAILFLGASGTGKSTQAELWNRYAGAPICNGDRVLLRKKDGIWHVYGYPCCGSSAICENRTLPLGAIVALQQGAENAIEEMTTSRRIFALSAACELYPWDAKEIEAVLSIATELAEQTMLRLVCRADEGAVLCLKKYLEEKL